MKACLMQNVSLVAFLVLEIRHHKISPRKGEQVIKFGYSPEENGFNFEKMSFMSRFILFDQKFQQFSSRGRFFHFQNFWDVSMRKQQQQLS